jgi:hypothetical protein
MSRIHGPQTGNAGRLRGRRERKPRAVALRLRPLCSTNARSSVVHRGTAERGRRRTSIPSLPGSGSYADQFAKGSGERTLVQRSVWRVSGGEERRTCPADRRARRRVGRVRESVPGTAHAWHDRPASRRMGSPGGPFSGALVGHCHDRSRSLDLSPCLAALVWT